MQGRSLFGRRRSSRRPHWRQSRFVGPALLIGATLAGCTGVIADSGTGSGGPDASGGGEGGGGEELSGDFRGSSAGLRLLSVSEYRATLRDLLGVEVPGTDTFQADTPVQGFTAIGATRVAYSAPKVERFEQVAYELAGEVFAEGGRRQDLVGCEPSSSTDPCIREFLASFARRAFRRPATAAELDTYAGLVASTADPDAWTGLAYAIAAILQSPSFLYRVELGEPDAAGGEHLRLTGFELATRLAYLVTGSTPDDELLDAAESGALDDEQGLSEQLERLLASPAAQTALMTFLEEQLDLHHVHKIVKVPEAFPDFTPALAEAMAHEMYEVVRDVAVREPDDLLSLFSRRDTYVNGPLAALYGVPGPESANDWIPVTLPEDGPRAGLLGFAGFLASHSGAAETSVTKRGFFVVSKLLCREIPAPPGDVITVLPEPPAGGHVTMRERVEQHMSDPSCKGCHLAMDPPGLALEHFDALGVYRETDGGLAIDATGEIDGEAFDGARELGELLAAHPDVSACFARRFHEYALGTALGKKTSVTDLVGAFEDSGRRLPDLVRAVVLHDSFRLVSAPR